MDVAWMAWTWQTGLLFVIAATLLVMTGLAVRYPEAERYGVLRIPTTRGDRLFCRCSARPSSTSPGSASSAWTQSPRCRWATEWKSRASGWPPRTAAALPLGLSGCRTARAAGRNETMEERTRAEFRWPRSYIGAGLRPRRSPTTPRSRNGSKEFQPTTLTTDEQTKELQWFAKAAEPYKGMEINVVPRPSPSTSMNRGTRQGVRGDHRHQGQA